MSSRSASPMTTQTPRSLNSGGRNSSREKRQSYGINYPNSLQKIEAKHRSSKRKSDVKKDTLVYDIVDATIKEQGITTNDLDLSTPRLEESIHKDREEIIREPSKLLEKERNYFGNNAQTFWKEQDKWLNKDNADDFHMEISTATTSCDDKLLKEMSKLGKQSKALTLWSLSQGTSSLSEKGATSSYFMNDYDRYMRSETEKKLPMGSHFFKSTIDRRISRPSSATSQQMPSLVLEPIMAPDGSLRITGNEFKVLDINDRTWRTYSSSASGRAVTSIYHPITKRSSRINNFMERSQVTNESLYTFITTEQVKDLNLEMCPWLDNKILKSIGELCPRLTTLNFQNCTQVRDSTIRAITNGCPNIFFLNLGMCYLITDEALSDIFRHCRHLKVLSVHSCEKITGSSFIGVQNTQELEVLDVSYCTNLEDVSLQFVSEYCVQLVHVDLSGCKLIADDGLSKIVQHCTELETFRLTLCDQPVVTSRSLAVLTKFATKLKVLDLTGVRQLNDECLEHISRNGQNLELLCLNGCNQITDASINCIEEFCHNLKCIEVCSCRLITVQSLLDLIHSVKNLKRMILSGCNISDSELSILRAYTQRCTVLKHAIPTAPVEEFVCFVPKKPLPKKKIIKKKSSKK